MIARLQRWLSAWRLAYSCLYVQLCAYQELRVPTMPVMPAMPQYLLSDDATEDELREMAAEQRALTREIPGTIAATIFNLGDPDPVGSCPSIGFGIPDSASLSNPMQS